MPIPEPQMTIPSHQETLQALKEAVEILTGVRKDVLIPQKAVTWNDLVQLGLIQPEQVPKR